MSSTKIKCSRCHKIKPVSNFYSSNNEKYKETGTLPYCKECCKDKITTVTGAVSKASFINLMKDLNKPFIVSLYQDVKRDDINKVIGNYIKKLNINKEYKNATYKDSVITSKKSQETIIEGKEQKEDINDEEDIKNENNISEKELKIKKELLTESEKSKQDCIKFLGYDPFKNELEEDKPILYNSLISYLDSSTQEDSFKQPVVVQIVKTFNQINRIDQGISEALSDTDKIISNEKSIKSLVASKRSLLVSILASAKDNGISVNYNNNKSQGGNTLNGILKKLEEIGLIAAQLNLFDIHTNKAMKQVADISNRSILDQLMLDENDSKDMLVQQNQLINNLQQKLDVLQEENRKLKIELKSKVRA